MATKWLEMVVSDHYLKKYSCKPIQTWRVHLLGKCSESICFEPSFWPCWPNFGPLVATKLMLMVVSDHYLKQYWCNPIQIWCIQLLGKDKEIICFWATLVQFRSSSGHQMTENCGFLSLSEKVFIQFKRCLYIYLGKCSEIICLLAMLAKFRPSSRHKMPENVGFRTLFE